MARGAGAALPRDREARQRRRAAGHEGGGRRARSQPAAGRGAGGAARDLRRAALLDHPVPGAARRGLRPRHAARDPARGARRVPPPPQPLPALPPRAPDRRHDARHRARHTGHLDPAELFDLFHFSRDPRVRAGGGGADREVRLALCRDHLRRGGGLHPVYGADHRVAHGDPPPRQRARLARQHARDRQPAQLRDGEVLRQRGVRGAALRRAARQVRARRDPERGLARRVEHRPEPDHRRWR